MTKIDSRFRQQCSKLKFQMDDMEVLGLSLFPFQKQLAGTWLQRPGVISVMNAALFAGQSAANMRLPPCKLGKNESKFYIFPDETHTHTIFHTQLCHTHTSSFFVTHHLSHTTLSHTQLCFTSRSSTTSFVFPSFPVPATTFGDGAHYWKKLPCGVIQGMKWKQGKAVKKLGA